jgi:hypothetical protein
MCVIKIHVFTSMDRPPSWSGTAPNDLFSWNNRYNKCNVTKNIYTFSLKLCMWTYSVHACVLKPWRGSLPWLPAISSSCHVFPLSLSGLNWRSLSPLGGPGPSTSKMAPLFTGSVHTPSPGFRTGGSYCFVTMSRIKTFRQGELKGFFLNPETINFAEVAPWIKYIHLLQAYWQNRLAKFT